MSDHPWPLALLIGLSVMASPAQAQPSGALERAEITFREGKRLMAEGSFEEACAKFQESQLAAPGSGTLLNLADCQERVGRLATSWATFRAAAALSRAKGKAARAEEAQARATALEPQLPRLEVVVPAASKLDGLVVFRNDTEVREAEHGKAIPVDPGTIIVVAEAPGHLSWSTSVTIPAAAQVTETVIPRLVPEERARAGGPLSMPPPVVDGTPLLITGGVLAGVGGVALLAGSILGAQALGKNAESNEADCVEATNLCTARGLDLRDEALLRAHLSTGLLIGGGVLAAGGVVLLLTSPGPAPSPQTGLRLQVTPGGMSLGGTF